MSGTRNAAGLWPSVAAIGWVTAFVIALWANQIIDAKALDAEQAAEQQQKGYDEHGRPLGVFQKCVSQVYGQDDIVLLQHNGDLLVVRVQAQCVAKAASAKQGSPAGDPQQAEALPGQGGQQQAQQRARSERDQRKLTQAPATTDASMPRTGGAQ